MEIPDDTIDQDCNGFDTITCFIDTDQDGFGTTGGFCGDGICDPTTGEDCTNCGDCAGTQTGNPTDRFCCGAGGGIDPVDCDDPRCTSGGFACGSTSSTVLAPDGSCDTAESESATSDDCNDGDAGISPGATEIVDDGIDQDCNGFDTITCILDADQDGFGTNLGTTVPAPDGSCDAADSESTTADDCNDGDASINPGAAELVCDGIDNDCDVATADVVDGDGDGLACDVDCDDGNANCTTDCTDSDMDGYCVTTDCDDADPANFPGNAEVCDGQDNDCAGRCARLRRVRDDNDGDGQSRVRRATATTPTRTTSRATSRSATVRTTTAPTVRDSPG